MSKISPASELYRAAQKGNYYNFESILYHYTSPESLLKIVSEQGITLYFTQYTALNDISEGMVLRERYSNACERLYEENKITLEIKNKMLSVLKWHGKQTYREIVGNYDKRVDLKDLFVCSFSKNGDSLPMWNYYVKNGGYQGYNLGLLSPYSHCDIADEELLRKVKSYEVIYTDEDLYQKMLGVAEELMRIGVHGTSFDEKIRELDYTIALGKLMHKAACFSHEEEVRLVLFADEQDKKQIKYRTKNGVLIPYLEVRFFPMTLKEITMGPLMERELAEKNLRQYLNQKGYKNVAINSSSMPIRY